jgi:hypothetical protein
MAKVGDLIGTPERFRQHIDLGDRAMDLHDAMGRVNFDDLKGEFEEAGPVALYIGALAARARRLADSAKYDLEQTEARASRNARQEYAARGERLTDAGAEEAKRLNPEVHAAQARYLDAKEAGDVLENAKFALARRQEWFKSLTGLLVAEMTARRDPALDQEWHRYQEQREEAREAAGLAPTPGSVRRPMRRR